MNDRERRVKGKWYEPPQTLPPKPPTAPVQPVTLFNTTPEPEFVPVERRAKEYPDLNSLGYVWLSVSAIDELHDASCGGAHLEIVAAGTVYYFWYPPKWGTAKALREFWETARCRPTEDASEVCRRVRFEVETP